MSCARILETDSDLYVWATRGSHREIIALMNLVVSIRESGEPKLSDSLPQGSMYFVGLQELRWRQSWRPGPFFADEVPFQTKTGGRRLTNIGRDESPPFPCPDWRAVQEELPRSCKMRGEEQSWTTFGSMYFPVEANFKKPSAINPRIITSSWWVKISDSMETRPIVCSASNLSSRNMRTSNHVRRVVHCKLREGFQPQTRWSSGSRKVPPGSD